MQNVIKTSILATALTALPVVAFAQSQDLRGVFLIVSGLINGLIGLFITIAIVVFFWGLIKYIISLGDDKAKGLSIMLWGVVAIFVMVSVWGLVRILQSTLGINGQQGFQVPQAVQTR